MKLNQEQLAEIRVYIFATPRFRETYNELYDHIVNALEELDGEFNIALVAEIVTDDFGGFSKIAEQEVLYQKQVIKKYTRLIGTEMLNSFKFPGILGNFCLLFFCIGIYIAGIKLNLNIKPLYKGLYIIATIPLIFYLFKRYIADRKHIKASIKYEFLHLSWMLAFCICQVLFLGVYHANFFNITPTVQLIVLSISFFAASIFIRAFVKLYFKKINVLTV